MEKQRRGFTLIELLVVISIIALLMSIMAPALTKVREQAKNALCMSRLHQWGAIFSMYADDNDGQLIGWHCLNPGDETYAPPGTALDPGPCDAGSPGFHEHCWMPRLHHFYGGKLEYKQIGGEWKSQAKWDFCMCPSTSKTWADGEFGGPTTGWDFGWVHEMVSGEWYPYYANAWGSYGKNSWVSATSVEHDAGDNGTASYWNTTRVRGISRIPLFGDSSMMGGFPNVKCEIPQERYRDPMAEGDEISRWVQDRHHLTINLVFLDFTVRKIGLKQLWQLYWQRDWDLSLAPDPRNPEIWPSWLWPAPMMELGF